ncbi:MAG TPA: sigma-70 family RNA polymerase sigma factor [Micromonosporaceae bacterium]|jgi:RNA polymerase sigma-70 factor (ECF subfamily)
MGDTDGTRAVTESDLSGEAAGQVTPDLTPPASRTTGAKRANRRPDQRDETRQDVNRRYGTGNRNRSAMPWPTGPTRPLPPIPAIPTGRPEGGVAEALVAPRPLTEASTTGTSARPTIPAAREETVELPPLATSPGRTNAGAAVPTQPDQRSPQRSGWAGDRPGTNQRGRHPSPPDGAVDVWELVERAQDGDTDAFGQIYHRYLDTVHRFIYFRVGNRQLAEDLTAETFLRALKRIGSVTWQGRDLGAWLVTIARNLVADYFKSGRHRFELPTSDVLDADAEERGPEGSPEAAVVDHITNVALLTAVRQLNREQRECIILRFLQGFSVAETAQAMGKNEGAIKALQYRAVRALHRLLPEGFLP